MKYLFIITFKLYIILDSAVDSLAVQKCMGKDKCDENKGKDNLSLITEVERTINFWGFKNAELVYIITCKL